MLGELVSRASLIQHKISVLQSGSRVICFLGNVLLTYRPRVKGSNNWVCYAIHVVSKGDLILIRKYCSLLTEICTGTVALVTTAIQQNRNSNKTHNRYFLVIHCLICFEWQADFSCNTSILSNFRYLKEQKLTYGCVKSSYTSKWYNPIYL